MTQIKLNFQHVRAVVVERDRFTSSLVAQMLRGFGMSGIEIYHSAADARKAMEEHAVDLCLVEAALPDVSGADLVRWLRKEQRDQIRHIPVMMMAGYSQSQDVSDARDAGANMVVKKPLSPRLLFDRLSWIARTPRPFVETDDFAGPDRRFRDAAPPNGAFRRSTDAVVTPAP